MCGRLEGKVAIVTGGGSGFGRGIVDKFTSEGARVLAWDIDGSKLKDFASGPSGSPEALILDATLEQDWRLALAHVLRSFGKLDIVVNNAGVVHRNQPSETTPEDEVDRMWRVNVKPIYYSSKVIVPYFREVGHGQFINLSSISTPRPRPGLVWYAASKGAVTAATRGLAAEYAPYKIRVNCIQPVFGDTGMAENVMGGCITPEKHATLISGIPLGRGATPEDIGNAACYLASDEASFLTGVCLDVDGGRSLN
ncbi:NAD(P)-binding protein [Pseudovirgaria hyperparasitica]|uniref:NAD(P)-binding protein n=1 Tax=Pseudovirgaria hyperparasitica TaxID=470096 RepID=A0A6A6W4I0_9PEZI|nr:NAD(P)-binding protein [Pseudovirgaria hyperparasitica]KAF2757838.1 NAD(P)-binding protein [Pseudovirgaria hyperparasitica]